MKQNESKQNKNNSPCFAMFRPQKLNNIELTGKAPKTITSLPTELPTERGLELLSLALIKISRGRDLGGVK